jgi:hypothetical protein
MSYLSQAIVVWQFLIFSYPQLGFKDKRLSMEGCSISFSYQYQKEQRNVKRQGFECIYKSCEHIGT